MAAVSPFAGREQEVFDAVCDDIACERKALGEILKKHALSPSTFFRWMAASPSMQENYARAKEVQAELMVEDILAIADDGRNDTFLDDKGNVRTDAEVVNRSRLRVDSRKWLASKLLPKKYGDRSEVDLTSGGKTLPPINFTLPATFMRRRGQGVEGGEETPDA